MNATDLEKFSSGWPGVAAATSSEDEFVLSVAGRVFTTLCLRGPERGRLSFAVEPEHFVGLTAQAGVVPAHYPARPFWITLTEPERFARAAIETFVRRSYTLVRTGLSKRQQTALDALESTAPKRRDKRKRNI